MWHGARFVKLKAAVYPVYRLLYWKSEVKLSSTERPIPRGLIEVGENTYGIEHLSIHSWNSDAKLIIGRYCSIADSVHVFLGGNHRLDWTTTYPFADETSDGSIRGNRTGHPATKGNVVIGNDVWIGSHASVMSGIKIGNGAAIAAYSHVVNDVPPYALVGGNPARVIRFRFPESTINRLLQIAWWNWPQRVVTGNSDFLCCPPTEDILVTLENIGRKLA